MKSRVLFPAPTDLGQLRATPGQLRRLHLTVHPNQTACSRPPRRGEKKQQNWCLSTLLNHTPCSSFTALLPVNSTNTKAANCCLRNLQPFNSTNPRKGSHEGRGVGELTAPFSFSLKTHCSCCACSRRRALFLAPLSTFGINESKTKGR